MTGSVTPNSGNVLRKLQTALLLESYRRRPELYARQVLSVTWWPKQQEIAQALLQHKRVFVKAAHAVGKTHVAGGLVNWHFDCFDPGVTLSTAPTGQQVGDVLWKEVRAQRKDRPGLQPKAPRMETSAEHFAVGYTARDDNAFQGRHGEHVLIVFDEATGILGDFWDAAEGMMTGEGCLWLTILNPTDTASRAYEEEQKGKFHVITVSCLDHPNIKAELAGLPAPFPAAVRLAWVEERVAEWCDPIASADKRSGDIAWPPSSGIWYRPGPLFEARVLGRWPTTGSSSVWKEAMWEAALTPQEIDFDQPLEVAADVARFGDDFTSILVRRGNCALWHETHNGWSTAQTAGRLKQLAGQFAAQGEDPRQVLIKVDDDGVGGGVVDQKADWRFVGLSGAHKAIQSDDYPNRRSEFWFAVAERADTGMLDLSRLSEESKRLLRRQVMAPTWKLDSQGRRVVEPKADTKKRIGRSPDDADALNLAFAPAYPGVVTAPPIVYHMPFSATEQQLWRAAGGLNGLPCPYMDEQGRLYPGGEIPAEIIELQAAARSEQEQQTAQEQQQLPMVAPGYGVLGMDPHWWKRTRTGRLW
ncbi:MAG TPA: hypothetical protein VKU00_18810 [Chthonomonadaceae bacterium]|nr:hypothetical protein [Chthonomonadaceae bacterium]